VAVTHRLSIDEFLALPEVKPYLELVHGEARQKMAADLFHTGLAGRLVYELNLYKQDFGGFSGPEPRVQLRVGDELRIYLPDVAFWAKGRPLGTRRLAEPPTVAVEIRSLGETLASQQEKCRFYAAAGVPVVWLIEPDARTVEVFAEDGKSTSVLSVSDTLTSTHLPGFAYPVTELFSVLDEIG
jgi:Uma2 family endonuclease